MFRGYVFQALLIVQIVVLAGFSAHATSEQPAEVDQATSSEIIAKLKSARPDLEFGGVTSSPLAGIYQVPVIGGPTLYVAKSGEFFFDGDLYQVTPTRYVNLREQAMIGVRKELLAAVDLKDMIVFAPEAETRGVINVFTDVDCGYCRKFHREVPELNKNGIEVRYLAFPRAGIGSPSADKLVSAWCSDTPRETLTELKNGASVETRQCADNPVADHYLLGQKVGVNGTPALVLADGVLIPGYRPAADLMRLLGIE